MFWISLFGWIAAWLLASVSAQAETVFGIPPYLFRSPSSTINVAWKYAGPPPSVPALQLFRNGQFIEEVKPGRDQDLYVAVLSLPSCHFGAEYSYQLQGMAQPEPITDVPCPGDESVRFSLLTDTQGETKPISDFVAQMKKFAGQFVVHGGDIVQHGSREKDWEAVLTSLVPLAKNQVILPLLGNHEYRGKKGDSRMIWERFFQTPEANAHYAVGLGPVRLLVLNSNFEEKSVSADEQFDWLRDELQLPAPWKIVILHHPPYSNSIGHTGLPFTSREHTILQKRFVPLFEQNGVSLVLAGHAHLTEQSEKNGVHYLTAGSTSGKMGIPGSSNPATLRSRRIRSVIQVEATSTSLHVSTIDIQGQILDDLLLNSSVFSYKSAFEPAFFSEPAGD